MYSRRSQTEERRNKRSAYLFILLTLAALFLIFTYGIPTVAKFAAFLLDIRKTGEAVEISDTTPPPPPHINDLPVATKEEEVEISGTTEAGSNVLILINGKEKENVADSEGKFSVKVKLAIGLNTIEVTAKDASGNESQKSSSSIELDKEPPKLEVTKPSEASEFFGTKQRQITIEGVTEEGSQVQINNRFVVVDTNLKFSYTTTLNEGTNTFQITAQDAAGNKTEKTLSVSFTP